MKTFLKDCRWGQFLLLRGSGHDKNPMIRVTWLSMSRACCAPAPAAALPHPWQWQPTLDARTSASPPLRCRNARISAIVSKAPNGRAL